MVDPQQRLALKLSWKALEHAHIPPSDLKGANVGVFLGTSTNNYQMLATMGLGTSHHLDSIQRWLFSQGGLCKKAKN